MHKIQRLTRALSFTLILSLLVLLLTGFGSDPEAGKTLSLKRQAKLNAFKAMNPVVLDWRALMPDDYFPEPQLFIFEVGPKSDLMAKALKDTPVVEDLAGQEISLAGYVVPLSGTEDAITEFLLVPNFGACIHVPPPPANQMIYVVPKYPLAYDESWDPIVINGALIAEGEMSEYGAAGYIMNNAILTPYNAEDMQQRQELH